MMLRDPEISLASAIGESVHGQVTAQLSGGEEHPWTKHWRWRSKVCGSGKRKRSRHAYRELFGEESRSSNHAHLFRRIAWRLQAKAQGDLSERARKRALELAEDAADRKSVV